MHSVSSHHDTATATALRGTEDPIDDLLADLDETHAVGEDELHLPGADVAGARTHLSPARLSDHADGWSGLAGRLQGLAALAYGPTLRRGAEGPAVEGLQRALSHLGHPLTLDGRFGPATETAVRAFQARTGLTVDGVVGPATKQALAAALSRAVPAPSPDPVPTPVPSTAPPPPAVPRATEWHRVPADDRMRYVMALLVDVYGYPVNGAAGLVGNLWAESGVIPNRVEGSRPDAPMRARDFHGLIVGFSPDEIMRRSPRDRRGPAMPGIGLAQWTSPGRRAGLFAHVYRGRVLGVDVLFDMDAQVDYLVTELRRSYPGVDATIRGASVTVNEAADDVVYRFEIPGRLLGPDRRKLPRHHPQVQEVFANRRRSADRALRVFLTAGDGGDRVLTTPARQGGAEIDEHTSSARRAEVAARRIEGPEDLPPLPRPEVLYDTLMGYGDHTAADHLRSRIEVIGHPGGPFDASPVAGDLLVRRPPGEPGAAHVAMLVTGELITAEQLLDEGLTGERAGPGRYAHVVEGGARPHRAEDRFARRVTDPDGSLPTDQLLARTLPDAAAHESLGVLWPCPGEEGSLTAETSPLVHSCAPGEGPPAGEPNPGRSGPHPTIERGTTAARSRRPSVGWAQASLNRWIDAHTSGRSPCPSDTAEVRSYVATRFAALRADGQLPLTVDCRFGPSSQTAARAFQACHGLVRDGVIGPATWPLLKAFEPAPGTVPGPRPPTPPTPPTPVSLASLEARYFPPPGTADSAPFSRASGVEPIIDGRDYFATLAGRIAALRAGDAWYVTGWWLDPAFRFASGRTLGELLVDRAAHGVDVRVIVWANRQALQFPSAAGPFHRVVTDNIRAAEALRARADGSGRRPLAGRVLIDWSGNAASSHHMKLNVLAHRGVVTGFVGGIDYLQNRLDAPMHRPPSASWHDAGIRVTGHAAGRVLSTFTTRWTEAATLSAATYDLGAGSRPFNPSPLVPFTPPAATPVATDPDTSVQVPRSFMDSKEFGLIRNTPWRTLPRGGVHEIRRTFQRALGAAQRYIYIEDQGFDATSSLFPSLVAACRRGVKVIAVLPGRGDPLDAPGAVPQVLSSEVTSGILAHLTPPQRLNLAVWHLDGITVHSKLFLVDDEMFQIGSANFMDRSMQFTSQGDDSECSVAVVSTGSRVVDLRVALWAEHLRVAGGGPERELRDLSRSLGFWRASWGTGVSFPHPDSRLVFVGPRAGGGTGPAGGGTSGASTEAAPVSQDLAEGSLEVAQP